MAAPPQKPHPSPGPQGLALWARNFQDGYMVFSLSLSLHFNGHFPSEPGLAGVY